MEPGPGTRCHDSMNSAGLCYQLLLVQLFLWQQSWPISWVGFRELAQFSRIPSQAKSGPHTFHVGNRWMLHLPTSMRVMSYFWVMCFPEPRGRGRLWKSLEQPALTYPGHPSGCKVKPGPWAPEESVTFWRWFCCIWKSQNLSVLGSSLRSICLHIGSVLASVSLDKHFQILLGILQSLH